VICKAIVHFLSSGCERPVVAKDAWPWSAIKDNLDR
jgi:hypothetical protein